MDDNLPLRKISLTCLETIIDTMPDKLDASALMHVMPELLADKDEIKLQSHQVIPHTHSDNNHSTKLFTSYL